MEAFVMNEEKQKQDNDQEEVIELSFNDDDHIDYDELIEELSHTTFSDIYNI